MKRATLVAVLTVMLLPLSARAEKFALMIGVNKYAHFPEHNLNGCVNDIVLMSSQLVGRFNFKPDNVRVLVDEEATAAGILAGFDDHLIGRSRPGDLIFIYFSGHGAQMRDDNGDEADGLDEILCPHDLKQSRRTGLINFVRDDTIDEKLRKLSDREVVVIFDCCHSGTGTRDIFSEGKSRWLPLPIDAPGVRIESPDEADPDDLLTTRAFDLPAESYTYEESYRDLGGGTRNEPILIAACRANEKAQERQFVVDGKPQTHGALTTNLALAIQGEASGNRPMTYDDLRRYFNDPVVTLGPNQHPQLEVPDSKWSRRFLSYPNEVVASATPTPRPTYTPIPTPTPTPRPTYTPVAAITPTPRPTYPPEPTITPTPRPTYTPVATLTPTPQPTATPVATPHYVRPNSREMLPLRTFVASHLEIAGKPAPSGAGATREQLRRQLSGLGYVEVVDERFESEVSVFFGTRPDKGLIVGTLLPGGQVTWRDEDVDLSSPGLESLFGELKRMYLVNNLVRLRNPGSAYEVQIAMVGGRDRLQLGDRLKFRVSSSKGGYLTLINVDSQGGVTQLLPNDYWTNNQIRAGETVEIPSPRMGTYFELQIMEPLGREYIKALVTERPLTLPVLGRKQSTGGFRSLNTPQESTAFLDGIRMVAVETDAPPAASSPDAMDLSTMKPDEWGEASLVFTTIP